MAVLGLRFCARAFSSCGKWGPLFIAVHGPLTIAASLVAEHRLQTHRLSNCGSRALSLHGMCDLPRTELEPVSPALAGRFSTTAPPGKPNSLYFKVYFILYEYCYSSFLLISICMEYLFPSLHFQSVCVPRSEVGLLSTAHIWVLFCIHSPSLCLLVRAFNPYTFKVIIYMYVPITIFLIALCLFL